VSEAPCTDCGIDTLPLDAGGRAEWYMVTYGAWEAAGMPHKGYLCVGCIERRLGRSLTGADFIDCPVNDLSICDSERYAWSWRTARLVSRLPVRLVKSSI
jgi:hypothetical protein